MFDVLTSLVGLIALGAAMNLRRAQRPVTVELQANCLLTRRPLIFVTGLRTPFYFSSYFNEAPSILREHGYQVEVLRLPWLSASSRRRRFTSAFLKKDAIWIVDPATAHEFADLLNSLPPAQVWTLSAETSERIGDRLMEFFHRLTLFVMRPQAALRMEGALHFTGEQTRRRLIREAVLRAEMEWEGPPSVLSL